MFISLGRPPASSAYMEQPYAPWPLGILLAIEEALHEAAVRLRASRTLEEINSADENQISAWLQALLCELLQDGTVDGFTFDIFGLPTRDSAISNFSGKNISKKPDLTFYFAGGRRLTVSPLDDGIFCECKIIDKRHTLRDYVDKGILRYVDGTYAFAVPTAHMIGFVRAPLRTPAPDLVNFLRRQHRGATNGDRVALIPSPVLCAVSPGVSTLCTEHRRDFTLRNGRPPGPIELRHVWLALT